MDSLTSILQLVLAAAQEAVTPEPAPTPLDIMWQQVVDLGLIEALMFISFGVVCLFYGWRIFKILVTICFGLIGLLVAVWANEYLISGNVVWLAMFCVVVFAVFSIPLMRWGVTVLGALSGGILTAGVWLALGLPQEYVWMGGLVGLVAGAMVSFIVFKVAVMLFTCLGGSTLMVVGILAVLYDYMADRERLQVMVYDYHWFLPTMILVPMIVGIILQHRLIKTTQDWSV